MNPADAEEPANPTLAPIVNSDTEFTYPHDDESQGDGSELVPALDRADALSERRTRAMWLWFQGKSTADISRELGVGERQVRTDLARARQEWGEGIKRKLTYELNKRLTQYDMLKVEFFAAWKASQVKSVRAGVTGDAEVVTQPGDPRFLTGYRECLDRECKLLGLDSPEKIQIEAPVRLVAGVDLDSV